MYVYYFEKLDVWQNSRKFVKLIYQLSEHFPTSELYGLSSQLRRSTISISANIAEGFSRKTDKDKARFINLAYSSGWETMNHIILAKDLNLISNDEYLEARSSLEQITNQLNSLHYKIKG